MLPDLVNLSKYRTLGVEDQFMLNLVRQSHLTNPLYIKDTRALYVYYKCNMLAIANM